MILATFFQRMKFNKKKAVLIGILIFVILVAVGGYFVLRSPWKFREDRPIKIAWIDSYHEGYFWSEDQISGFRDFLDGSKIDYEINAFHMNTKVKASNEEKQEAGERAIKFLEEYEPDLIYLTDDNAQFYIGKKYANTDIPLVFSGMNEEPEFYNYDKTNNVAGVLERTPLSFIITLFKSFYPMAEKGVAIGDDSETGLALGEELNKLSEDISDFEFIEFENPSYFSEYKSRIEYYQDKVDVIILTALHTIKRETGEIIPLSEIIEWTVKNSEIPEAYMVDEGVCAGAFLTISISPYDYGVQAANFTYSILIDGKSPSSFEFETIKKVNRFLNLARANDLGLGDKSQIIQKIFYFEDVGQADFDLVFEQYRLIENYSWEVK